MSKTSLKKEISSFTSEQLVELVLNIYEASKEAKSYLEFFLNPDGEKLLDKKTEAIAKEINRNRRGYCRGRISHIRRTIKEFESYGTGPELTSRLMFATIQMLMGQYRYYNYPGPLLEGTYALVGEYLRYCEKYGMISTAINNLEATLKRPQYSTDAMKRGVRQVMQDMVSRG